MQVDVEQVGLAVGAMHDVAVPHLLRERLRGHDAMVPGAVGSVQAEFHDTEYSSI
jgi:hypothetical protein